jgi:diguanylate cyclase (GGDEF)-like protein/PAS domain S-box-containing protein
MIKTNTNKENISIRMTLIITFIILMLTTIGFIGYIIFSNWMSAANETAAKMAADLNREIYHQVDMFMHVPEHMNVANQALIADVTLDINKQIEREKFFVKALSTYSEDVYSFSYGTEKGEYYGARRNENNAIEIMRNNTSTGGHSWYYSVTKDAIAGERVLEAGKFDPRTRDWYKAAKEVKKLVFSPVYKHFIMDDLTVSAAVPVYGQGGELQGVLGTHITLSRINNYLQEIAQAKNGYAMIIEKDSGALIANSVNMDNFKKLEDGNVKRITIDDLDNQTIVEARNTYYNSGASRLRIATEDDWLHINVAEYNKEGLNWLVISAVPESLLTAGIVQNTRMALLLAVVALILSIVIYLKLTKRFWLPMNNLIDSTEKFSQGDLTQRTTIVRNDEIGKISIAFNKMADTICTLVNNLEVKVKERTLELEQANNALQENKDRLQLILDSAGEGIFGIDNNGNCTFCNASCIKMLGYKHQDELIGKNMHWQIHHSRKDGSTITEEECKIRQAHVQGKGIHVDTEVFWRADGTCFDVECFSYPQYKDGEVIGLVVTFMDITERKKREEHIKYLSYHDSLTGLKNRMFFEDELRRIDTPKNLPISIVFGDANGLKLTNDIFGHATGDELLKKTAAVLKRVCRGEDLVARIGGDEFAILLPNTEAKDAAKIISRVKSELAKEQVASIKCSMSMGHATKTAKYQNIDRIMESAEADMYKEKMFNRKTVGTDMINAIVETIHNKCPREKLHSLEISEICQRIGQAMELPEPEVRKLKAAGFLHDIGKITLDKGILLRQHALTEDEAKELEQHAVTGYRILNLFDETMDLAEGVLCHHENWDGSGYPRGLKGEEIPILARIIKLAESYNDISKEQVNEQALEEIKKQSGKMFDPEVVDIFIKLMS